MPARIVSTPFVIGALVFLYLTWENSENYALYIIPCVVLTAISYVFSPQINWWWYSRNPPKLDPPLRQILQKRNGFYQKLNPDKKKKFRERVALFMIGNDFMPQVVDSVEREELDFIVCLGHRVESSKDNMCCGICDSSLRHLDFGQVRSSPHTSL